jgi:hypothetical protein
MSILEAVELAKTYRGGDGAAIEVLDGLNLTVARGEISRSSERVEQARAPSCTYSAASTIRRADS